MTDQEITYLQNCIRRIPDDGAKDKALAIVFKAAADSVELRSFKREKESRADTQKTSSGKIKLTESEAETLPEDMRASLAEDGYAVNCRYYNGVYQIRYHRDGRSIEVASKNPDVAKEKFLAGACKITTADWRKIRRQIPEDCAGEDADREQPDTILDRPIIPGERTYPTAEGPESVSGDNCTADKNGAGTSHLSEDTPKENGAEGESDDNASDGKAPLTLAMPSAKAVFTPKELNRMAEPIKTWFKDKLITAHVSRDKRGYYTVRVLLNGELIKSSGTTRDNAVESFIKKLNKVAEERPDLCAERSRIEDTYVTTPPARTETNPPARTETNTPARTETNTPARTETNTPARTDNPETLFSNYTTAWLDIMRKPYIKADTYRQYMTVMNNNLLPLLGNRQMAEISQMQIQGTILSICEQGHYRTAQVAYQLLKSLFEYAEIDDVVVKSPMKQVRVPRTPKQSQRTPLTREEEKETVDKLLMHPDDKYAQAYVFILYTGLRRSELSSAEIIGDFVKVNCAKCRMGTEQRTRLIPITPMLRKVLHLINLGAIKEIASDCLTHNAPEYLGSHCVHELRHTFATRCQECGVQREYVSLWVGHAADSSMTSMVYTHLEQNKEVQLEQAAKVNYEL